MSIKSFLSFDNSFILFVNRVVFLYGLLYKDVKEDKKDTYKKPNYINTNIF